MEESTIDVENTLVFYTGLAVVFLIWFIGNRLHKSLFKNRKE